MENVARQECKEGTFKRRELLRKIYGKEIIWVVR